MAKTTQSETTKTEIKKVPIMVPKPHGVIGDNDLTVSVNGVIYQIQYDRTVYVPENVAEIIRSSIKLQNEKKEVIESFERSGRGSIADL